MEDNFDYETIKEVEQIFFSLEEEYIKELLKVPEFQEYLVRYLSYSNKNLLALFSRMQEQMENGDIKEEDENVTELSMIACILAMSEKVKRYIKAKHYVSNREETNERTR